MRKLIVILTGLCLLCRCGGDSSTGSGEGGARVYLTPESLNMRSGSQAEMALEMNLDQRVFGVSMAIHYNPMLMEFDEDTDFTLGDYFGGGEVTFVRVAYPFIYLAVTLTQGQDMVRGRGELGSLVFTGTTPGSCLIEVVQGSLHFWDSEGEEIVIDNLEIGSATVSVQ